MLKHVGKEVAVAAISFFFCGCYWAEWLASATSPASRNIQSETGTLVYQIHKNQDPGRLAN